MNCSRSKCMPCVGLGAKLSRTLIQVPPRGSGKSNPPVSLGSAANPASMTSLSASSGRFMGRLSQSSRPSAIVTRLLYQPSYYFDDLPIIGGNLDLIIFSGSEEDVISRSRDNHCSVRITTSFSAGN